MNKRAGPGEAYEPTRHEHVANTVSHAVAILPSFIAFHLMLEAAHRDLQENICWIYGTFTSLLFITSTSYHACEWMFRPGRRRLRYYLHIVDRAAIYFFIAASYTPWLTLRHCGIAGVNLKWIVWACAILGVLYQYNFHERYKTVETVLYGIISGVPGVAVFAMNERSGLDLMMIGGLVYAIGVVFFKMDGVIPFAHAIWHGHVVIGAGIHLYAVHNTLLGPDRNNPVPVVV